MSHIVGVTIPYHTIPQWFSGPAACYAENPWRLDCCSHATDAEQTFCARAASRAPTASALMPVMLHPLSVNVGLLEARNGFGLSIAKLPKTLQTRLRKKSHRNRRCEDVQQTLQPEDVKQTPMSALKCHHQLISSVGSVRGRYKALANANR